MSLSTWFGLGMGGILSEGAQTVGRVTEAKTCWWLKVNTKPVRRDSLDGAVFPHRISFQYQVNGREYSGRRYISWRIRCPRVGEQLTVCYNEADPARYGVDTAQFGMDGGLPGR